MEIKIGTKSMLKVLTVLSWIIFIGLCIEVGGILFNTAFSFFKPIGAKYFWNYLDLSSVYQFDKGYFLVVTFFMVVVAIMKAIMFYLIIKILLNKELTIVQPFTELVRKFIIKVASLSIGIGIFSKWGSGYVEWLQKQSVIFPDTQYLKLDGADVWLFMGVILLVIAYVFKRGIEIQQENDLTV
ncbi:DUF2975 domain-containing protein [Flavobacterium amniphilum]|uniref:DUF2975 domain-containing protein n=1 Tax=Flavobacterium amniphilum TaxID=1834035 RepID=UPI002029D42D|nr:DUF2975 domain-containing protein [Flavobacterium amniphilum]MCL9807540.1 DUF2975 domain-containing protein [Flavobacterium amniphilum]